MPNCVNKINLSLRRLVGAVEHAEMAVDGLVVAPLNLPQFLHDYLN